MKFDPVSVVVPVRDREKLLVRCLDSVRNQSYRPVRLIVVDNASADNSLKVALDWKGKYETDDFQVSVVSEEQPGAAAARNRGLLEVDTERMLFFDSDDVMLPELLVTVMETFDRNPKLDMVYWRTAVINSKDEVIPKRFAFHDLIRRHIYNAVLSTQAYALRTSFVKRAGGWNSRLMCWNDWELGLRLLANEPNIKGIFRVLVHIYPQQESITGTDFHSRAGEWEKSIEAIEKDCELFPSPLRERVLQMMLYRRTILAAHYKSEGHPELAAPLLDSALGSPLLSKWRRRLLRYIYEYTAHGGRAAYLLWK